MTITDLSEKLKAVKIKETEILFRTADKKTLTVGGLYYGVKDANGNVLTPQVGEEPNCIVAQVVEAE